MKNKLEERVKQLEAQLITHSIFIESLLELLYENNIIDQEVHSKIMDDKIKLIEEITKSRIKQKKEDPENPMFYGPHGEA